MNLFEFTDRFPDEDASVKHFKKIREKLGVKCKKCGHSDHYWKSDRESFQLIETTVLPWVHSAIGIAKKALQGLHHSIGKEYLQNYLNEF